MRRLLVPLLALPLLASVAPAHAGCDEETCYPTDCIAYDPVTSWQDVVYYTTHGDPGRVVLGLLPPTCPP